MSTNWETVNNHILVEMWGDFCCKEEDGSLTACIDGNIYPNIDSVDTFWELFNKWYDI